MITQFLAAIEKVIDPLTQDPVVHERLYDDEDNQYTHFSYSTVSGVAEAFFPFDRMEDCVVKCHQRDLEDPGSSFELVVNEEFFEVESMIDCFLDCCYRINMDLK